MLIQLYSSLAILVRVHQGNRTKSMCMYMYVCVCMERERERERGGGMYFKELAHIIVRLGKSKIHRVDQQDGDPGKSCNLSLKAGRISSSSGEVSVFFIQAFS